MKERNIIGLAERFAKYSTTVSVTVDVKEVKESNYYMAKKFIELFNRYDNFNTYIMKYAMLNTDMMSVEDKELLARISLVRNRDFFIQIGWKTNKIKKD